MDLLKREFAVVVTALASAPVIGAGSDGARAKTSSLTSKTKPVTLAQTRRHANRTTIRRRVLLATHGNTQQHLYNTLQAEAPTSVSRVSHTLLCPNLRHAQPAASFQLRVPFPVSRFLVPSIKSIEHFILPWQTSMHQWDLDSTIYLCKWWGQLRWRGRELLTLLAKNTKHQHSWISP